MKNETNTTVSVAAIKLPKGWRMVRFGDVVRDVNVATRDPKGEGLERFVGLEHLDSENLQVRRWGVLADTAVTFTKRFRKGQVLFGKRRAYQRKVAVAEFDGICSSDILTFEPKGDELIPALLPFIVQSDGFFAHALGTSAGSLSPRTRWGQLADYKFPLPPKEEQQRVAEILGAADEVSEHFGEALRHVDALRRNTLLHALAGASRGSRTRPSPIGPIPQDWDVVRIGEAGDVQLGRQRAPKYQSGAHTKPYLRVANVFDGYLDLSDVLEMDFDEADFRTFALKPGDILLNEGQSRELVGRCAVFNGEIADCCFQNTLIRFRAGERLLPAFAFSYLQHAYYRGAFAAVASQTTSIAHLGAERFARLFMPIPPKKEQERIVRIVSEIASRQKDIAAHCDHVKKLKQMIRERCLAGVPISRS